MPPNMPLIFCLVSSSTFFTASLQAATTMSCNISTSPATSGSILTARTFLWPSIFTVTIPPPEDASTRISATSCCMRSCICCACFIMFCMLPGNFTSLLLQIADRANLAAEYLLKFFHFRIGQRPRRRLALGSLASDGGLHRRGPLSRGDRDLHRTAKNPPDSLIDIVCFHAQKERRGRCEAQFMH